MCLWILQLVWFWSTSSFTGTIGVIYISMSHLTQFFNSVSESIDIRVVFHFFWPKELILVRFTSTHAYNEIALWLSSAMELPAVGRPIAPLNATFLWARIAVQSLHGQVDLRSTALATASCMTSHCSGSGAAEIA